MVLDPKLLPDVSFFDTDVAQIEADDLAAYELITGRELSPGDPERLFLSTLSYRHAVAMQKMERAAKMNLLALSEKEYLDQLGFGRAERLQTHASMTTFKVTLTEPLGQAHIIPAGTRVGAGEDLIFSTDEVLTIDAGDTEGEVSGICETAGAKGNGYYPAQISKLIEPLAYVASISNTTISAGGTDVEDDDRYKIRIATAPRSYSVAGPERAYLWHAKTVSQDIADVAFDSPSPAAVALYILMDGGQLPTQEIITQVQEYFDHGDVTPDTDVLTVAAPTEYVYQGDVTYWISTNDSTLAAKIQKAVELAFTGWQVWQRSKLGRDVAPDELIARLKNAGAKRVLVNAPAYTMLGGNQVAVADPDNCALKFGGFEDE
ncbi:MAG: baseplate J/gp47 family protein [Desulfovibrio sp.]